MTKFVLLTIGVLLLIALVATAFQYLIIGYLKKREKDGEEWIFSTEDSLEVKMYSGYVESDFVLQNCRCWQVIFTFD